MPEKIAHTGRKRWMGAIGIIVVVGFGIYFIWFRGNGSTYQLVTVTKGTINEIVSVTGNTTPIKSLDLGFQNGGTIASVDKNVGDPVNAGDVIARLNTNDLQAQLAQAQANVDAAQAQLQSLQAGAQPADIQASEAALAGGQQSLLNMYGNVGNTVNDAYSKSNDAVRNQLAPFFSNPETNNPQLTFSVNNSQTVNTVQSARLQVSAELNKWQIEATALSISSPSSTLDAALQNSAAHLAVVKLFLANVSQALLQETGLSAATMTSYNNALTAANNEVSTAMGNVSAATQNIASQKITIQQLQAQLNLKLAGSTTQQIANQQAQVEAAQANVQSVQAKIAEAVLISPIDGVITVQDAKTGEIASPGATLVSIISANNFEVDAQVPETDIGKVAVGNPVSMTFDAFQGETFAGKVFYIDPAQTIVSGVVDYKIKVSFVKPDPRIKSGLTANLNINTETKQNALILPQFAVLQSDSGTFVEVLKNGAPAQMPVTLGIQDDKGNVEITNGVTEGEQVVNIGIK